MTNKEYQKKRNAVISWCRGYILDHCRATNAKDYEIAGRALCGCSAITFYDDGSILNGYGYLHRTYSNADWRASELIDEAIREYKNK